MNGLAGLAIGAAAYDIAALRYGWETISSAFWRLRRHPAGRLVLGASVGALAAHLYERGK